jgi:hypothetical protein
MMFLVLCRCCEIVLLVEVSHNLENLTNFFLAGSSETDINTVTVIFYVFLVTATIVIFDVIPLLLLLNISTIQLFTLDLDKPEESLLKDEKL